MTHQQQGRHRRAGAPATSLVATLAMVAGALAGVVSTAIVSPATAEAATTTAAAANVPGSNCAATSSGTALSRAGWVANTNAHPGSADAPANALDGSSATRFSTNAPQAAGQFLELDLGSKQSFDELAMSVPNSPTDYARGFYIEVSDNSSSWTTVASCTGTTAHQVVRFSAVTAQYVAVVLTAADTHWWSVDELNLFQGNCAAIASGTALGRSGWVASTNAHPGSADAPANALDGNPATRFSTDAPQAAGQFLEVDLGAKQTFDELEMSVPGSPTDYARGFYVEVSDNSSSWATVASCTGTATPEVVSFPAQTAQYVAVVLTAADTNWWSVDELDLYTATGAAPVITSAASLLVLAGQGNVFTIAATGTPTPALAESGALPPGLVFHAYTNGTATISGTPPANATGTYNVAITATNGVGSPAVQHLVVTLGTAPVITSASAWRVLPGRYNAFTVTTTGSPAPHLSESGTLPPGLVFHANANGTATISGTPPTGATGTYVLTITALNGVVRAAIQHLVVTLAATTATTTSVSSSANPASVGQAVTYTARVSPVPNGGSVSFTADGAAIAGCTNVALSTATGQATCSATYPSMGRRQVQASYSGHAPFGPSASGAYNELVNLAAPGYWLATANGQVYGLGAAQSFGSAATSATTGPVVGMAASPSTKGYWVVTANGRVSAFGDARFYGDLPSLGKHVSDVVAIAPTTDGRGYYLVGADGGFFTFGDARFHGSVPGLGFHVKDVVGVVATPSGQGYLLVGADGGVFTFGTTRFYGSLPGLGKHVHDIRAILPSSTGMGYILVGADGGAFNFGSGARFHGSLPGEGVKVSDVVGIALTPDNGGYYMAGADGHVYNFGDANPFGEPVGLASNLPVAAIAGT